MTAEEFDAHTQGRTLSYATDGIVYGREEYRPNRRVRWAFENGECVEGTWYRNGTQICFVYEHDPEAQCWQFYLDGSRMRAEFMGDGGSDPLYEIGDSDEALTCLGPQIGV